MIEFLISLLIVGVIMYVIRVAPIDAWIKQVGNVVCVVVIIIMLLRWLEVFAYIR